VLGEAAGTVTVDVSASPAVSVIGSVTVNVTHSVGGTLLGEMAELDSCWDCHGKRSVEVHSRHSAEVFQGLCQGRVGSVSKPCQDCFEIVVCGDGSPQTIR